MFSSLHLADGALTVDDVHRLRRPPHRIVLPACRSGVVAQVAGQDVIGFAAALLGQGTAGVVASIADVDDAATVQVMLDLHAGLVAGLRLDEALREARRGRGRRPGPAGHRGGVRRARRGLRRRTAVGDAGWPG